MDAKKLYTIDDLVALPESQPAELIHGELIIYGQPSLRHGKAQRSLGSLLDPFDRKGDGHGPGGWWIITEAGVRYSPNTACRHDLAGWKRERLPTLLDEEYVSTMPDWVCEILSSSNRSNDLVRKKAILHQARVPHYWTLDPSDKIISVHRWAEAGYVNIANCEAGERARLEPFEVIEVDISYLLGLGD
jgi:Uma2 family endonuclease